LIKRKRKRKKKKTKKTMKKMNQGPLRLEWSPGDL
jgi:hypothetical protein